MLQDPEAYWNAKHPQQDILYEGRPVPGRIKRVDWDIRRFIWHDDAILKTVLYQHVFLGTSNPMLGRSGDLVARDIQEFVVDHLKYVGDEKAQGVEEFWLFPTETYILKQGDCEDGAIMIASFLLNAGIAPWRVRVSAGWVKPSPTAPQGGHGYCCYCRETDNQWVVLDWCYNQDSHKDVSEKPLLKERDDYADVWFSFNHLYAWSHSGFAMAGRVKEKETDT